MNMRTVLVVDGDAKNLQILKESLESSGFKVNAVDDGIKAWETVLTDKPDVIVSEVDLPGMDGFRLLAKLQKDPVASSIPLIFLTNRRNVEDRLKSFRSGVKDFMIKPLHVKEVVARLNMILRRLERTNVGESQSARKVVGRLEEKSVEELVESCGAERRTGVLTLYGQDNLNGEIYFRDGAVVNARFNNFRAEKAVYQMLPWRRGHFVLTLREINVEDEITVSNLGLLLQGFKRLQERERFVKQLPSLDAVLVKTSRFEEILKKKTISSDAYKFISLFDGHRTVSDIIAESIYDDLKTLEKTTRLYAQGFIRPIGAEAKVNLRPKPEPEFPKETIEEAPKSPPTADIDREIRVPTIEEVSNPDEPSGVPAEDRSSYDLSQSPFEDKPEPVTDLSFNKLDVEAPFRETQQPASVNGTSKKTEIPRQESREPNDFSSIWDQLFAGLTSQSGRLVIIGSDSEYRREFVSTLTSGRYSEKVIDSENGHSFELGKIITSNQRVVEVFGLSTQNKYLQLFERISGSMIGYVLLVAGDDPPDLGYLGYLTNSLKSKFAVPHIIAVYHPAGKKPMPLDILRYTLKIDESEQLAELDAKDIGSVRHVLEQLVPPKYRGKDEDKERKLPPTLFEAAEYGKAKDLNRY